MLPHDEEPINALLPGPSQRTHHFKLWLDRLRAGDPAFAEASALYPDDMGEWQAAVHLLTGCREAWAYLGDRILAEVSLAAAVEERERPTRPWSHGEHELIRWAAHLWDVGSAPVGFPYMLDEDLFERWMTACRLYRSTPPPPSPIWSAVR